MREHNVGGFWWLNRTHTHTLAAYSLSRIHNFPMMILHANYETLEYQPFLTHSISIAERISQISHTVDYFLSDPVSCGKFYIHNKIWRKKMTFTMPLRVILIVIVAAAAESDIGEKWLSYCQNGWTSIFFLFNVPLHSEWMKRFRLILLMLMKNRRL